MRRFDETGRLDRVCARGELLPRQVSDLVATLVAFHAQAAVAPAQSRYGSASSIIEPARDNSRTTLGVAAARCAAVQARLQALRAWTEAQFVQQASAMAARLQAGWVRECHGDLHLANMVLIDGHVQMFDCIEFNPELRWSPRVASEVAFTYVDLLAHQQAGLANWFLNLWLSHNGDYAAAPLIRFYAVYRALVIAKVAAIRAGQSHGDDDQTLKHLAQAEQLMATWPLQLTITHGFCRGCGKTVAAQAMLQSAGVDPTLCLQSNVERKRLFGCGPPPRKRLVLDDGIYTVDAHARTYARLLELATGLLRCGWSVIVDAAFLQASDRDRFRALARSAGASFSILAPVATADQLRERILARQMLGHDASEATLEVLARQLKTLQPLAAHEPIWPTMDFPIK